MGAPVTLVDPDGQYVDASGGGSGTSEVEVTNFPATQPVSGTVEVTNFPATQPVSGTVGVSGTVPVSGPITNAQMTAQALAKDATLASVVTALGDILAELQTQTGLLNDIKTNTTTTP